MLDMLIHLDHQLFYLINRELNHQAVADFFRIFTNLHHYRIVTAGILPLLFVFWILKRKKRGVLQILALIFVVGTSDAFSYRVIKQITYRARPNNHPQVASLLKVEHGPKSSSFPSNHAMNMGTMASALTLFFPQVRWLWWSVAGLIAFSRVYVGVHFPIDVVAGLIMGWLWFQLWHWLWLQRKKLIWFR